MLRKFTEKGSQFGQKVHKHSTDNAQEDKCTELGKSDFSFLYSLLYYPNLWVLEKLSYADLEKNIFL